MKKQIISTTYVQYKNEVLLINWRPYGPYCGVGGFLGLHGDSVFQTAQSTLETLVGIRPADVDFQLVGRVVFTAEETQEHNVNYIFKGIAQNKMITKHPQVHSAKWVPQDKLFNYKLFPNNERMFLEEVLNSTYFEIELKYEDGLVSKNVPILVP